MPYIVTTKRRVRFDVMGADRDKWSVSRRAVATLEEAQQRASDICDENEQAWPDEAPWPLPESGCTVTLPDGTVIEVEAVTWQDLALAAGLQFPASVGNRAEAGDEKCQREILDAYNARQS